MTVTDTAMQITVSHRIPVELAQWVARRADELGITKSELVRRILNEAQKQAISTEQAA